MLWDRIKKLTNNRTSPSLPGPSNHSTHSNPIQLLGIDNQGVAVLAYDMAQDFQYLLMYMMIKEHYCIDTFQGKYVEQGKKKEQVSCLLQKNASEYHLIRRGHVKLSSIQINMEKIIQKYIVVKKCLMICKIKLKIAQAQTHFKKLLIKGLFQSKIKHIYNCQMLTNRQQLITIQFQSLQWELFK